jgi:hypothetical protein
MKKVLFALLLMVSVSAVSHAQDKPKAKAETKDEKVKVKPKTTAGDKVHNVIHPKRKHYHGVKAKAKKED